MVRHRFAHHPEDEQVALVRALLQVRDRVLHYAEIASGSRVLDLGCGTGLLAFGAVERVGPDGRVVGVDISAANVGFCKDMAAREGLSQRMDFVVANALALPFPDGSFDVVVCRSVLLYLEAKDAAVRELARVLKPGGRASIFEPINQRLRVSEPPLPTDAPQELRAVHETYRRLREQWSAEPGQQRLADFDEADLRRWFEDAGFAPITLIVEDEIQELRNREAFIAGFKTPPNPLADSPFARLAHAVGESLAQAYVEYMSEVVARFGRCQRVPVAWLYGVRQ